MSILMDALKQQAPVAAPVSQFWRNLAISLALLLAVLAGFIAGYLLLPGKTTAVAVTEPAVTPASSTTIAATLLQAPATAAAAQPATVEAPAPVTETLPEAQPIVTVTTNTARAEPVAQPEPEVSAELRERFASALAETEQSRPAANLTAHSAPAQDVGMLDLTLQRQLPRLKFEAHVFATQPAQRWVKVNGKSLQEGQWITADVRLKEITPHYVLLEFGNTLFSMRALSEW
jgi:general secretion pathway protein B